MSLHAEEETVDKQQTLVGVVCNTFTKVSGKAVDILDVRIKYIELHFTSITVLSAISFADWIFLVSASSRNSKKGIRNLQIKYLKLIPCITNASEILLSPPRKVLKLHPNELWPITSRVRWLMSFKTSRFAKCPRFMFFSWPDHNCKKGGRDFF